MKALPRALSPLYIAVLSNAFCPAGTPADHARRALLHLPHMFAPHWLSSVYPCNGGVSLCDMLVDAKVEDRSYGHDFEGFGRDVRIA